MWIFCCSSFTLQMRSFPLYGCITIDFFILPSMGIRLVFSFLVITNETAMNILMWISRCTCTQGSRNRIAGLWSTCIFSLIRVPSCFPKQLCLFSFLAAVRVSVALHQDQNLPAFFTSATLVCIKW